MSLDGKSLSALDEEDACWESTSDVSMDAETSRGNDDLDSQPWDVPTSTAEWTVTPNASFRRADEDPAENPSKLCSQCSQIDFQAAFRLDASMVKYGPKRTCSFSGLSRSMLESNCPACQVFAQIVYKEFTPDQEASLDLDKTTFEGQLIAKSSDSLCHVDMETEDYSYESYRPVILMIVLLMPPLPYQKRPSDSFYYWRSYDNGEQSWENVQPRGFITPAAEKECPNINLISPVWDEGFCYGLPLEEKVNRHRLTTMLHRCQQHHPQCRADRGFDFPQKAHVVDCKNRQIVPMIDGHDYLALSYVWGSESAGSRLKQPSNDEDFHLPPLLPQMVEDAIEVTIFLGYRYLWIDSVCINQSHTTEKAFQIQQMGNIYSHAVATICALGAHANVSLPGVSQDRRTSPFFQSQGSTYISLPEPDFLRRSLLQTAEWSKRAWTFQEAMLSRRCIFFTEEQVSLVCRESHQTESLSQLCRPWIWGSSVNIYGAIYGDKVNIVGLSFERFARHYIRRQLSYETDALDAFTGLLSVAATQSYFGLLLPLVPTTRTESAFALALLWQVEDTYGTTGELRADFPSWSWIRIKHGDIDTRLVGTGRSAKEELYSDPLQRALCTWNESENPWTASIWVQTLEDELISIDSLFNKYSHTKVVPEQSQVLKLSSYIAKYKPLARKVWKGYLESRDYTEVALIPSDKLPFDLPRQGQPDRERKYDGERANNTCVYDSSPPEKEPGEEFRLAVLLVVTEPGTQDSTSYWMALEPAYEESGRQFYRREGIISVDGKMELKEGWQSMPRDEVWLI